jgi:hypothetical protein
MDCGCNSALRAFKAFIMEIWDVFNTLLKAFGNVLN